MALEFAPRSKPISASASKDGSDPCSEITLGDSSAKPSTLNIEEKATEQEKSRRCTYEIKKSKREQGWRKIVRNFTPA
jgi:hypothetical protein